MTAPTYPFVILRNGQAWRMPATVCAARAAYCEELEQAPAGTVVEWRDHRGRLLRQDTAGQGLARQLVFAP